MYFGTSQQSLCPKDFVAPISHWNLGVVQFLEVMPDRMWGPPPNDPSQKVNTYIVIYIGQGLFSPGVCGSWF